MATVSQVVMLRSGRLWWKELVDCVVNTVTLLIVVSASSIAECNSAVSVSSSSSAVCVTFIWSHIVIFSVLLMT